jgi:WD40-like Beta Propeller Repeat
MRGPHNKCHEPWLRDTSTQKPSVYVQTPFEESNPAFSPDGRWIVYSSDRTGRPEIYVRPFPSKEPEHKISRDGGRFPRWRGDEIFFLALDGTLMRSASMPPRALPGWLRSGFFKQVSRPRTTTTPMTSPEMGNGF